MQGTSDNSVSIVVSGNPGIPRERLQTTFENDTRAYGRVLHAAQLPPVEGPAYGEADKCTTSGTPLLQPFHRFDLGLDRGERVGVERVLGVQLLVNRLVGGLGSGRLSGPESGRHTHR